ncbi:hypothetical protein I9P32_04225, partial [Campylobacter peloridis]|nr:hypothetical protein [Campylobacter peloridis]
EWEWIEDNAFTKNFNGQGYTLKNINIDFHDYIEYAGIFGKIKNNEIKNLNIDYMGGGINSDNAIGGTLAGEATNVNIHDIALSNFKLNSNSYMAKFIGVILSGKYNNINIKNSDGGDGGFAVEIKDGEFNNIKIDMTNSSRRTFAGFAPLVSYGVFKNIEIIHNGMLSMGFGNISDGDFRNIKIIGVGEQKGELGAGFSRSLTGGYFQDILLENFKTNIGFANSRLDNSDARVKNIIIRNIDFMGGNAHGFGGIGYAENILLENLRFIGNGTAYGFGSIKNGKNIVLKNITFKDNYQANGFGNVESGGNIILKNITFENNRLANGFGGGGNNILVQDVKFINNEKASGFGGIGGDDYYNPSYVQGSASNVVLKNFTFTNNKETAYFCIECESGVDKIKFENFNFNNSGKKYGFAGAIKDGTFKNIDLIIDYNIDQYLYGG